MMLTILAKILTVSRKSHHPIEPLLYYSEPVFLKYDMFGNDRVPLENEVSPNFEKSGNVGINSKLNGKQACEACNYCYFSKARKNVSNHEFLSFKWSLGVSAL